MKPFKRFLVMEAIVSPSSVMLGKAAGQGGGKGKPQQGQPGEGDPQEGEGQPQPGQGKPGKGKPQPGKDKGKPQPGEAEGPGGIPTNDMLPPDKKPKGLDGSDTPGKEGEDKEDIKDIKRKAHEAHEEAMQSKGLSKANTKLTLVEVPSADYKAILEDMFGSYEPKGSYSYSKANRRNPYRSSIGSVVIPGKVSGNRTYGNILIGIDTSGSINEKMLQTYLGAIYEIADLHKESLGVLRVVLYSGTCHHYEDFVPDSEDKDPSKITERLMKAVNEGYSGGNDWGETMNTMFNTSFKDTLRKEKVDFNELSPPISEFNGYIFLTDGYEWGYDKSFLPEERTVFLISVDTEDPHAGNQGFFRWIKATSQDTEIYSINLTKNNR